MPIYYNIAQKSYAFTVPIPIASVTAGNKLWNSVFVTAEKFFVIPFYLQCVPVHSSSCVKLIQSQVKRAQ
jgi:hypothetical protein